MRTLIYVLLFVTTTIYAQQTSPYAEFYALSGDTVSVLKKVRIMGSGIQAKIFSSTGKELNAKIKQAEVSFVQNATVVRTITIRNSNRIYINEFRAVARPGDKIIIKISSVENLDRKSPVYLSKIDFSFTLE
jgi:hypothetical protein